VIIVNVNWPLQQILKGGSGHLLPTVLPGEAGRKRRTEMRTRWRIAAILAPLCAAALAAVPASAAAACQATALPTLGHENTQVTGGDPTGRYLVGLANNDDTPPSLHSSLVWAAGKPRLLDTEPLRPYIQIRPTAVNRHGVIVGYRLTDPSSFHTDAWSYRGGRFTILPGLTATDSTMAVAVNARGDVVGTSLDETALPWHGVVWPADRPGTVRELTVPGQPVQTFAVGVDEDGTVLGHLGTRPGETPYIWPPRGAPYRLIAPPGIDYAGAYAIRDGWVVGTGQQGDHMVGLRWNLRRHTAQVISTENPLVLSVNRRGTVGAVGAIIHRDGRAVSLGADARPLVVTDRGTAAGNTREYYGEPVTWTGC
jgi:uncharacterized membrane protein